MHVPRSRFGQHPTQGFPSHAEAINGHPFQLPNSLAFLPFPMHEPHQPSFARQALHSQLAPAMATNTPMCSLLQDSMLQLQLSTSFPHMATLPQAPSLCVSSPPVICRCSKHATNHTKRLAHPDATQELHQPSMVTPRQALTPPSPASAPSVTQLQPMPWPTSCLHIQGTFTPCRSHAL